MAVGTVTIDLIANTAKFEKSIQSFEKKVQASVKNVSDNIKKIGIAATVAGAGMAALVKSSINTADQMAKVADKIGTTTEELSKLRFAAELTGVSQQTLDTSLQRVTRRLSEAANGTGEAKGALEELGISAKSLNKLPLSQQMGVIADRMQNLGSQSDRVRIAMKLFDSEGVALVNTLANGSKGLDEFGKQAEALGLVIDTKTAKASEQFNDKLTILGKVTTGMGIRITSYLLPALNALTDEFVKLSTDKDFLKATSEGLKSFTSGLITATSFTIRLVNAVRITIKELKTYFDNFFNFIELTFRVFEVKFKKLVRDLRVQAVDLLGFEGAKKLGIDTDFNKATREIAELESGIFKVTDAIKTNYQEYNIFREGLIQSNQTVLDVESNLKKALNTMSKAGDVSKSIFQTPKGTGLGAGTSESVSKVLEFKDSIKDFKSETESFLNSLDDTISNTADVFKKSFGTMEDAIVEMTRTGKFSFKDFANSVISDIARIAIKQTIIAPLARGLGNAIGSLFSAPSAEIGGVSTLGSFNMLSGARALGGPVTGSSSYLVGERGPEIFTPSTSGRITPNSQIGQMGNSNNSVMQNMADVSININAIDTQTGVSFLLANQDTVENIISRALGTNSTLREQL